MNQKNIFYSWQTDSDPNFNRSFIEDCLKRAISKLNREDLSNLIIDRDTKNVAGMPDIGHTILEKIANSVVVVADLTLINPATVRRSNERPVSNPNVLFELGYAFGKLGPQTIVGVFNTASGKVEDLPFDLRPKRLMTYRLATDDDKAKVRMKLVDALADAIRQCLGDTEDEQIHRNSRIHRVLSELWVFGTEIEEWYGIENLPEIIQSNLAEARQLPNLIAQSRYPEGVLNMISNLISDLESAATLALNEDNWFTIKQLISSTASDANFIHSHIGYKPDRSYHDESVKKIAAVPGKLDEHVKSLQNGQLRRVDLENLSYELRRLAFMSLVPQHPQFSAGLKEISLDLRHNVLRWAKNTPKKDEAIGIVQNINERLVQLIEKFDPL